MSREAIALSRRQYGADGELRCIPLTKASTAQPFPPPTCPNPNAEPADSKFMRFTPTRTNVGARIEVPILEGEDGSRIIAFSDLAWGFMPLSLPPLLGLQDLELDSLVDWHPGDTRLMPRKLSPRSTHPLFPSECSNACAEASPFFQYTYGQATLNHSSSTCRTRKSTPRLSQRYDSKRAE